MDAGRAIRQATLDDVPGIRAILAAHGNDGPVTSVDVVGPYLRHLVIHHRALVTTEHDELLAFGATVDTGAGIHLADLFVQAGRLGEGIGRPLLAAVFGDAPVRSTFASDDPRALPLYVRAGMLPRWASLFVEGLSSILPAVPAGIDLEPGDPARLAALELAWNGVDRRTDHAFWASQPDADAFVVADHGDPVAIAYARARQMSPVRTIDHLVVRPTADPVTPTLAALRRAGRGGNVLAAIQGPSPLLRRLLDLGFLVMDRDQFMASVPGLIDPARLVPNPGLL